VVRLRIKEVFDMMVPLLFVAAIIAAQVPVFDASADMVSVTVTAVDERTKAPITDLKQHDFIIAQDSTEQPITYFKKHDIPASIVVLVDVSDSVNSLLPYIKRAAVRLIQSLRPGDEVQVAQFAVRYQELNDFTTDHVEAAAVLERGFVQGDTTALNRSLYTAVRVLEKRFPGDINRRRIIILLSDGEDAGKSFSNAMVLDSVRRSGVLCYVVHIARNLVAGMPEGILNAPEFMKRLAYESGGRLVTVSYYAPHELARAYENIADELDVQYHFGYLSPTGQPGRHDISVMLRSRSGIVLRHRRTYYIPLRR
jgi:VWFA-related protein